MFINLKCTVHFRERERERTVLIYLLRYYSGKSEESIIVEKKVQILESHVLVEAVTLHDFNVVVHRDGGFSPS